MSEAQKVQVSGPNEDGEIGLFWHHEGNRVELFIDTKSQHFIWLSKIDGFFNHAGDMPFPEALTKSLARIGIEAEPFDEDANHFDSLQGAPT